MWTYKIVNSVMTEDDMNLLGAEGWELIAVYGNSFYFKKPVV